MDVAETTLINPKVKEEGFITQEETNPTKTEGLITQITTNTNHNKQQHHKGVHTAEERNHDRTNRQMVC
jgi:hypothetical protein